jgi:hypothetical protein
MRRTLLSLCLLAAIGIWSGCGSDSANTGNTGASSNSSSNATRNGVVETNANVSTKPEGNPSNTATVVNNNGNKNTAGVSTTNDNTHGGNRNTNKH